MFYCWKLLKKETLPKSVPSMFVYRLRNVPHSVLWHTDAEWRISMCLLQYQVGLVRQRCRCEPRSCYSDCDCACLIIDQSPRCEMNARRTRGGSILWLLCSVWLSWTSFTEDTDLFFLPPHHIPLLLFSNCLLSRPGSVHSCPLVSHFHCFMSLPSPFVSPLFSHPFRPPFPCCVGASLLRMFFVTRLLRCFCKVTGLQAAATKWNNPCPHRVAPLLLLMALILSHLEDDWVPMPTRHMVGTPATCRTVSKQWLEPMIHAKWFLVRRDRKGECILLITCLKDPRSVSRTLSCSSRGVASL